VYIAAQGRRELDVSFYGALVPRTAPRGTLQLNRQQASLDEHTNRMRVDKAGRIEDRIEMSYTSIYAAPMRSLMPSCGMSLACAPNTPDQREPEPSRTGAMNDETVQ